MILFFPVIDGSGSTFTVNLLRDVYQPHYYYRLDTEATILEKIRGPETMRHLIHTGFWEGDHMVGPYVTISKVKEWLSKADKIVTSIRDPRKVLKTAATMGRSFKRIVDSFCLMSRWSGEFDMFFFPVDIDGVEKRREYLISLYNYLGLPEDQDVLAKWSVEWSPHNESKQFRPIKEASPEALDYLRSHDLELKPFFQRIGYKETDW